MATAASDPPSHSSAFPSPVHSVVPGMPRAFVQVLLDAAWDLVAVLGENGCTRYISPSNERLLGYAWTDLVGRNSFDLIHPDDRPAVDEVLKRLYRHPNTSETLKHRFRAADGNWRVLESTLQNQLNHPDIRGWVVHSRDVTDRDQLHAELDQARQHLRRLQLHPHFIFNVLHAIQSQLLSDPAAAAETIAQFGDLLRLSYSHLDAPVVPLKHEVDFVERYVDLYRHRFDHSITATFDVPESLREVLVPSLLLQPLVENALRHGLRPLRGGHLTVRGEREGRALRLTVMDDGVGLPHGTFQEGTGLSATRRRLQQMYGRHAVLRIEKRPEGGTRTTVLLPESTVEEGGKEGFEAQPGAWAVNERETRPRFDEIIRKE